METKQLKLLPFGHAATVADLRISGRITPLSRGLSINYTLKGSLYRLRLPVTAKAPQRTDGLWQTTCFECFIRQKDAGGYREFNFSPSGHWNVYRFSGYRRSMVEEPAYDRLPVTTRQEPHRFDVTATIDLACLELDRQPLQLALSAVTQTQDGQNDYWALHHPAKKPDFHHPAGFVVSI